MKRRSLLWSVFPCLALTVAAAVTITAWFSNRTIREAIEGRTKNGLREVAEVAALQAQAMLRQGDLDGLAGWAVEVGRATGLRVTIIRVGGAVIADSDQEPNRMANHADRPEIQAAWRGAVGERTGDSPTLRRRLVYVAVPVIVEGRVAAACRISTPLTFVEAMRSATRQRVLAAGAVSILLGGLASYWLSRRIVAPLREMQTVAGRLAGGDLAARLPMPSARELAGLAGSLNAMATQLGERIDAITRQKREAEAILASMAEGVIAIDSARRILNLNDAACRILGVAREAVGGRSLQEVVRNPGLFETVRRTLEGGTMAEGDVLLTRDGREMHLQVRGAPLRTSEGQGVAGAVLALNDVSRLRRLEVMRTEFAANVSHELRTPITTIAGFVETLLDGALDNRQDAERFLRIIQDNARRLNALITDLLALAGVEKDGEAGSIPLARLPLAPELRAVIADRQAAAAAKSMPVSLECPADVVADVNRGLFAQAVANLLDNAIAYSDPGKPVRVVASRQEREIRVAVVDQGKGIAAEHLGRLFERFYRVDRSRSRDVGGTGLGLAIVKHVAQAHRGRVDVQSVPGQGSTFTIVLPAP